MASMTIAIPKLKQVRLSRTKLGVEIAVKPIPLQSDMTISDYVIEADRKHDNRYAHPQLLLA